MPLLWVERCAAGWVAVAAVILWVGAVVALVDAELGACLEEIGLQNRARGPVLNAGVGNDGDGGQNRDDDDDDDDEELDYGEADLLTVSFPLFVCNLCHVSVCRL